MGLIHPMNSLKSSLKYAECGLTNCFLILNQVFVVPFQGSESSTSEGISKVFNLAYKYNEINKVLPLT
jgi:hypothetical protein